MIQNKGKKITLAVAGTITAIASITIISNLTFIRRLLTYPEDPITNTDWYQPLETVPGNPRAIPQLTNSIISQDSLNKIADYAEANNSSALLVLHRGELILERYWQGFTPSSTSNSMSLSKTIAALLIGIAIEEGQIKSELELVANYIPEWSQDDRRKITLQDLLYMQSGLRNQDSQSNPTSDLVQMYASPNVDAVALKIPAEQAPQQAFDYNNANTQILSEVLERATGERYTDYLATRLWQPLQTNDAFIWLDRSGGNPKTFCCLFATPRDWAKVGQLFSDRGQVDGKQVVPMAWLDKMQQPSNLVNKYGYHLWLKARTDSKSGVYDRAASRPFLAEDTFYLDGAARQRVYIIPAQQLVIVRIGERPEQWDDAFMPNTLLRSLQDN